jgi:hypothetical protein
MLWLERSLVVVTFERKVKLKKTKPNVMTRITPTSQFGSIKAKVQNQ